MPYKKTWGESLHCCAYTLSPADTRLSPQHWLGAAGCNSRAGLVRFSLAQAAYELSHGGYERVRCAACTHTRCACRGLGVVRMHMLTHTNMGTHTHIHTRLHAHVHTP